MTMIDLGGRELQRDTSQVIQNVENNGVAYRVTIQGRPTSVVVSRQRPRESGATLEKPFEPPMYQSKTPELVAAQLTEIHEGEFSSDSTVRLRAALDDRRITETLGEGLPFDDLAALVYRVAYQSVIDHGTSTASTWCAHLTLA